MSTADATEPPTRRTAWVCASALLVIVAGATSWSQPDVDSTDVWWHLASGRYIWAHGAVPRTDPFSHTALGAPWLNAEWLWGLLTWLAYRQQPDWVAWLNLGLVAATFSLVATTAYRASRSWLIAGVVTWLVAANCHWFFDVRPNLMTLFFTALLLATLHWRRAPWLWPPVIGAWANLHGGFVFGIGLLGLYLMTESVRALWARAPLPRAGWIGLGAAMLAVAVNPWGFEMYRVPLHVIDPNTPFRDLVEWLPIELGSLDPRSYSGRFLWTALAVSPALLRARRHPFPVALALVTVVMAFSARRFIALFAIAAAPALALGLAPAWDGVCHRYPVLASSRARIAALSVATVLTLLLWQDVRLVPDLFYRWTKSESHAWGAAAYLQGLPEPPRHLFHFFNWGGFLSMQSPSTPVFIDGRAATVYDDEIARDYLTLFEAGDGWPRLLAKYEIDAILVEPGAPLARAVRSRHPAWGVAHVDSRSILLFPPDSPLWLGAPAARARLSQADAELSRAYQAGWRGQPDVAEEALRAVVRLDPLQLHAYGDLMLLAAQRGDADGIRHWCDAALLAYPRRSNRIWAFAEYSWGVAGRPRARLRALERIHLGSPLIRADVLEGFEERVRGAREQVANEAARDADAGR